MRGQKLYLIHHEGRLDQFDVHKKDLATLYASFKPARVDAGGNPILDDLRPAEEHHDDAMLDPSKVMKGSY